MPANAPNATETLRQRLKLLWWPLVVALLFGAADVGEPLEDVLRTARNGMHQQPVSGDIVLVEVDEKSLRQIDNWPWPRATQAKLIDALDAGREKNVGHLTRPAAIKRRRWPRQ